MIKRHFLLYRRIRDLNTKLRSFMSLPRWKEWGIKPACKNGATKRVLFATGALGHLPSISIEGTIGVALQLRRAEVDFLVCDQALKACMMCELRDFQCSNEFVNRGPKIRCSACINSGAGRLKDAGFALIELGQYLFETDRKRAKDIAWSISEKEIPQLKICNVAVGEHAVAGALRFFARGDLNEDGANDVLRKYLESALLVLFAFQNIVSTRNYDAVVVNHGLYVPQGIFAEAAVAKGMRVVTWHQAYKSGCFIFNHQVTYHHGLLEEPITTWENIRWSDRHKDEIVSYLLSRWVGSKDWIYFQKPEKFDRDSIEKEIGINFTKTTVGLLTNVIWDAQLHYRSNAFSSMLDWLIKTIEYFKFRKDLQLLIRIHPAEITGTVPSRQTCLQQINKHFQVLPDNVFIIPATSRVSTYAAMRECDSVLIYGTKTGVELAAMGIPVIVAGEAWIRHKGITLDVNNEAEYLEALNSLPFKKRLSEALQEKALRYAYHFFFRRMIPLNFVKKRPGWPPYKIDIDSIAALKPGMCNGLDVICQGILEGTPFVYPAELKDTTQESDPC